MHPSCNSIHACAIMASSSLGSCSRGGPCAPFSLSGDPFRGDHSSSEPSSSTWVVTREGGHSQGRGAEALSNSLAPTIAAYCGLRLGRGRGPGLELVWLGLGLGLARRTSLVLRRPSSLRRCRICSEVAGRLLPAVLLLLSISTAPPPGCLAS